MKIVTNIIYFLADMCIVRNVLIILYKLILVRENQSLLLNFKYRVLYVQLNNPKATPNLKEPVLGRHHLSKNICKHLLLLDISHIWDCLAHIIKNYRFCRFNNKIEALVNGCNICYMT